MHSEMVQLLMLSREARTNKESVHTYHDAIRYDVDHRSEFIFWKWLNIRFDRKNEEILL